MTARTLWHCNALGGKDKPAIVFLHGFMGRGTDWLEIAEGLGPQYYCLMPDLPGHGGTALSAQGEALDFEAAAAGLLGLIEEKQVKAPVFVGYSMGGRLALYCTAKHPARFRALVLEGASPGLEGEERRARMALDEKRAFALEQSGISRFVEQWYEAELFASLKRYPERLERVKADRKKQNKSNMAMVLRGLSIGLQPSLWDDLESLSMPVLLIAGELDRKYGNIAQRMSKRLQRSETRLISNAGHNAHLEAPGAFVEVLRRFLGMVSGKRN